MVGCPASDGYCKPVLTIFGSLLSLRRPPDVDLTQLIRGLKQPGFTRHAVFTAYHPAHVAQCAANKAEYRLDYITPVMVAILVLRLGETLTSLFQHVSMIAVAVTPSTS